MAITLLGMLAFSRKRMNLGTKLEKILMVKLDVIIPAGEWHSLQMEVCWQLVLPTMMEMAQTPGMLAFTRTRMDLGTKLEKMLMVKLKVIIPVIVWHSLQMEVCWQLVLPTMMEMALTLGTFAFTRTRMNLGTKLEKILMVKLKVIFPVGVWHSLQMEVCWQLVLPTIMEMAITLLGMFAFSRTRMDLGTKLEKILMVKLDVIIPAGEW